MSASLVGSEMCISDSACSALQALKAVLPLSCCPLAGHPMECRGPRAPVPVSYTHLTLPTICSV
eukprot:12840703-Alexandrium_andersonii.AAC.1